MKCPEGIVVLCKEKIVCKLVMSLYNLKQAAKQWQAKFDQITLTKEFKVNECDERVYIKSTSNNEAIVCLYVMTCW